MNRSYINERRTVTVDGVTYLVKRYNIIGTQFVVHEAYRPGVDCATICYETLEDGQFVRYGKVGTERATEAVASLAPGSTERYGAVRAWYAQQRALAHRIIIAAFPDAATGTPRDADIETMIP